MVCFSFTFSFMLLCFGYLTSSLPPFVLVQAISYIIVSFSMYIVSQITPLEWRKASNCEHPDEGGGHDDHDHDYDDDEKDMDNLMFCSHTTDSLNSTDTYHLHEDDDEEVDNLNEKKFISDGKNIFVYDDELDDTPCECNLLDSQGQLELISYENNFNLRNSFWWAIATLIQQTTSDLYPKVFVFVVQKWQMSLDNEFLGYLG